jgi:hypothetical protein
MKALTATEKREYLQLGSKMHGTLTAGERQRFSRLDVRLPSFDWKRAEQLERRGLARRSSLQIPGTKIVLESITFTNPFLRPPPIRVRRAGRPSSFKAVIAAVVKIPPCAAAMGCLCAGHARGNSPQSPCDTSEEKGD